MESRLLVQMVREAYRYELTSFEMPSWGCVSFCNVCIAGAMALSVRLWRVGNDFGYKCIMDARAELLLYDRPHGFHNGITQAINFVAC